MTRKRKLVFIFGILFFFLFWMVLDGPFWESDSEGYITMFVGREPVYPLFLALCRKLPFASVWMFEGYPGLYHAVFFQNLLWAFAVYYVGQFVYEVAWKLSGNEKLSYLTAWGTVALQFAVCLMNRFLANRRAMYANHILTEALSMPLYLIFSVLLCRLLAEKKKRDLVLCAMVALLMILTRRQMMIVLIIWGIMAVICRLLLQRERNIRRLLLHGGTLLLVFLCSRLADSCYHYFAHGFFGHVNNGEALMCTMLYITDEEDISLFAEHEEREREMFREIVRQQNERGASIRSLPEDAGWIDRANHFGSQYDVIGYEIVHWIVLDEIDPERQMEYNERICAMYDCETKLGRILLRRGLGDYVPIFLVNFASGLSYSVARLNGILIPFVIAVYLLYIILLLICMHRNRETAAGHVVLLAGIVLCGIIVNCVVTGALIFPQGRYMIYGMGMFYTCLLLMIVSLRKAEPV